MRLLSVINKVRDTELDFHYDSSEVTINVCLGRIFTGGQVYFKGLLINR